MRKTDTLGKPERHQIFQSTQWVLFEKQLYQRSPLSTGDIIVVKQCRHRNSSWHCIRFRLGSSRFMMSRRNVTENCSRAQRALETWIWIRSNGRRRCCCWRRLGFSRLTAITKISSTTTRTLMKSLLDFYREIFALGEGPRSVRLLLNGDIRYSQASALLAPKHRVHTGRTWSQANLDLLQGSQAASRGGIIS